MYRVIKNGEQIALIEKPVYIKCLGDGTLTPATKDDCQGISVDSVPYNLFGCNAIDGVTDTVILCECDGGAEIKNILDNKAPMYTYGTDDLIAGSSTLPSGQLHFIYE